MARSSTFRQVDVKRAVSAARPAGITNPRIEIITPNGTVIAIVTSKPGEATDGSKNEWDAVLTS